MSFRFRGALPPKLGFGYGDFNCDGQIDLVTSTPGMDGTGERYIEIHLRSDGGWLPAQRIMVGTPPVFSGGAAGLAVGDLNGDGAHDVVVANIWFPTPTTLISNVEVFFG